MVAKFVSLNDPLYVLSAHLLLVVLHLLVVGEQLDQPRDGGQQRRPRVHRAHLPRGQSENEW